MENKKKNLFLCLALLAAVFAAASGLLIWQKNRLVGPVGNELARQSFLKSFGSPEMYDGIFSNLPEKKADELIAAGIVSHHWLAKDLIAEFYNRIGRETVEIVFLVSPDHFGNFFQPGALAYSSLLPWQTPFGSLNAETEIINFLAGNGVVQLGDSVLGLEHGISVEVTFVKKFFPGAKVVPLVLKNGADRNQFLELGKKIKSLAGDKAVMIVSSDFSHDVANEQAKQQDRQSIGFLRKSSTEMLDLIENDCRACLAAMIGFLGNEEFDFSLVSNKNSFDLSGQDHSVTSYVNGYYSKKDDVRLFFVGDLMFDRNIRLAAQKNGNDFIFEEITDFLAGYNLVVANLEGPLTTNKSVSVGSVPGSANNFVFTFDPSWAKTLFNKNIQLVNLGNNHILNFGQKGLELTQEYLKEAGVEYFGAPASAGAPSVIIKEIDGVKFGFVGYNQFIGSPAEGASATRAEINKLRSQVDIVIVSAHWDREYFPEPLPTTKTVAHSFIDAGADLVIGTHPHVIQISEEYKGKKIYYSLGNFVFDQWFNQEVRTGLGVIMKIDPRTKVMEFEEEKFYLQSNGQTIPLTE